MLAIHKALLEWLILGNNPSDLWARGCLQQGILPPQGTCIGPYDCISIATANLLPRGRARLVPCPPRGAPPTPPELGANLTETSLHPTPLSGDLRSQDTRENPQPTYGSPNPSTWATRLAPSGQQAPTSRNSPLLLLLSRRDLIHRRKKEISYREGKMKDIDARVGHTFL
jgi:hypothetical protein